MAKTTSTLLLGKRGLVAGVTNARSLGWAVARAWLAHGAEVTLLAKNKNLADKVHALWDRELPEVPKRIMQHDLGFEDHLTWDDLRSTVDFDLPSKLDMACHAAAFAPREALHGRVVDVKRDDFEYTMDSSVYSFIALGRLLEPIMTRDAAEESASLMTLTFDGSQRAVPGYGIMGPAKGALESTCRYLASELGQGNIRVNAISAGPINTLSARGLRGFHELRDHANARRTLPDPISAQDVGSVATFLASDLAAHVSGQTIFVDSGISSQAFGAADRAD